jgi:uncharacterized protein (DUF362 family)
MNISETLTAVNCSPQNVHYPEAPFHPSIVFPEFVGTIWNTDTDLDNNVYAQVRDVLMRLGLDQDNQDTENWRPFAELVKPGGKVTIKPNLVFHDHPSGDEGFLSMVTHASVIRPIVDYLLLSTDGDVKITICDAPLQSADIEKIIEGNGLKSLLEYYQSQNVDINFDDIRWEVSQLDEEGLITSRVPGVRDRKGYAVVDLKDRSAFMPIIDHASKLEITDYPKGTVAKHHNTERNEYLIGKSVLDSDLFINVPKLKTHRKAGITVAMKNLIGINGDKSWIAHHRSGGVLAGGDEFDHFKPLEYFKWHLNAGLKNHPMGVSVNRFLRKTYRKLFWQGKSLKERQLEDSSPSGVMEGSWSGNDTLWRTILDLNHIITFADKEGKMHDSRQRGYLAIVDGIYSGDQNGPMEQRPRHDGIVLGGFNPVAVDYTAAMIMQLNWRPIRQIFNAIRNKFYPIFEAEAEDIVINANFDLDNSPVPPFRFPKGWAILSEANADDSEAA